jgi:hypothetical protein
VLKIIAAISMMIDHIGLVFFPHEEIFRILGRIALPIFAFMIAEGCRYTRNKLRYFLTVFLLAFICQTVYLVYNGDTYMSILVTFSLAILMIYALQYFKSVLFDKSKSVLEKVISFLIFALSVITVYYLNTVLEIDYGFFGCLLPVFVAIFHPTKNARMEYIKKFDKLPVYIVSLGIGMLLLALNSESIQYWSFIALIPLLLYSGKRGKARIKYFFYVFYPVHLLLIEGVYMLINF